jgi:heme/copper-type cytochrome/quinol oxidase subunit 3
MPPYLPWGSINIGIALLSLIPNQMVKSAAKQLDLKKVRMLLLLMSGVSIVNLVIRWLEFPSLHCTWNDNAYTSIVWALLFLHSIHLVTDAYDTFVLTALFFFGPIQNKRFMDASENADYWYFVVLSWVPIYLVIYWAPRWL